MAAAVGQSPYLVIESMLADFHNRYKNGKIDGKVTAMYSGSVLHYKVRSTLLLLDSKCRVPILISPSAQKSWRRTEGKILTFAITARTGLVSWEMASPGVKRKAMISRSISLNEQERRITK